MALPLREVASMGVSVMLNSSSMDDNLDNLEGLLSNAWFILNLVMLWN